MSRLYNYKLIEYALNQIDDLHFIRIEFSIGMICLEQFVWNVQIAMAFFSDKSNHASIFYEFQVEP